jgi:hypothetical protein
VIEQHQESLAEACCKQMETLPENAEILHARAGRPRLNDIFRQYLLRCQTNHLPIPLAQTRLIAGTVADHTVSGMNQGHAL